MRAVYVSIAMVGAAEAFSPSARRPLRATSLHAATLPGPLAEAPDVGMLPDCPATVWNSGFDDVVSERDGGVSTADLPACPLEISAPEYFGPSAGPNKDAASIAANKEDLMAKLQEHGCLWFRDMELTKTSEGFRSFYDAMGLDLCLDPIHTSGLRKMISKKDGIYEEVNKPTLRGHYIGLHQESTHVKTSTYGAFVCFEEASIEGGEFLVADGARILRDMDPAVLQRIYENKVRISVSNLDFDFLAATGPLKEPLMDFFQDLIAKAVAPKFDMELEMLWGSDGKPYRLQAVEPPMSPVNRHPKTGLPVWFCNIHNHARYLRDNRPCTVPEVGMTDVYYGDLSGIPKEDLEHIDEVSRKHIISVPMKPGDIIFVDNYRMLHGRDIFKGDRFHAVAWFGEQTDSNGEKIAVERKQGNMLNEMLNNYVENAF